MSLNISNTPEINLMSYASSPAISSLNSNPWNNSKDSSPEPTTCDCQSQLKHYDWNGVPRKDLPDLCKRTMGTGNNEDAPVTESSSESDPEWEHCKTNRFLMYKSSHGVTVKIKRAKRKGAKNAGGNQENTNTKRGDIVDTGAEDPPCTRRDLKRKMSDKENSDIYIEKNRVSVWATGINDDFSYRVCTDRYKCPDQAS